MKNSRLILVNSNHNAASILVEELQRRGVGSIQLAANRLELPKLLQDREPDVVVFDYQSDEPDSLIGCSTTRLMVPHTSIVVISSPGPALKAVRSWAAKTHNIDVIIEKPLFGEHFFITLKELLRVKSTARGVRELNHQLELHVQERTAELDDVNSQLNAFMSSLAHDMRQPLISMGGFGALLDKRLERAGDNESRRLLGRISAAMLRVDACTNAMLELGQISRSTLRLQTVDFKAMAEFRIDVLRQREPERKVRLQLQPDLMQGQADKLLITLALGHLISNAWKFTQHCEQAEIEIGSRHNDDGAVVWWVKDNGVGFDMAFADKLFKPFQRLHRPDEFAGLGTGLAIVHAVITRHKGKIWAESVLGEGSSFFFMLGSVQPITNHEYQPTVQLQ